MKAFLAAVLSAATCFALAPTVVGQCFAPYQYVGNFVSAWDLIVADFNHDGFPDIAVAVANTESPKYEGNLDIILGNGDGTFQPVVHYKAAFGAQGLAAGDFNNDGNLDVIVVGNPPAGGDEGADVFLGNGDGTFRHGSRGAGQVQQLSTVVVGDFNGDGNLDAVLAPWFANHISALFGNGDGTMRGPFLISPGSYGPSALLAADLNGDGKLDIVTVNAQGVGKGVSIYLGNGDGTFSFNGAYATSSGGGFGAVAGDFNEDGKIDLAVAGLGADVFLGNGDGTFQRFTDYPAGFVPTDIKIGDFNGDHHLDLAMNQDFGLVSVLIGNGDGTFQTAIVCSISPPDALHFAVGDFNLDGRPDLALADISLGVAVELNTGHCP